MAFNYKNLSNAHLLAVFEDLISEFERNADSTHAIEQYEKAKREILKRMEEGR